MRGVVVAGDNAVWLSTVVRRHGRPYREAAAAAVAAGRRPQSYLDGIDEMVRDLADEADRHRVMSARPLMSDATADVAADSPQELSTAAAAVLLNVTGRHVVRLIADGRLSGRKRRRRWLVESWSVQAYRGGADELG